MRTRSSLSRILLSVPEALMLCCLGYAATPVSTETSRPQGYGVVRLPAIDGHDIRFVPFPGNGESFDTEVFSIAQDNFGFLWLGTTSGLYRYDGYDLKSYRHLDNDP